MTSVLIVDDHPLIVAGVRSVLAQAPEVTVVDAAHTGAAALLKIARLRPDVVVLDIELPDVTGPELTRRVRHTWPGIKVIALSAHTDRQRVRAMLNAGANAYVVKQAALRELLEALRAVASDNGYLSPAIAAVVIGDAGGSLERAVGLSDREAAVLRHLCDGLTVKQVAAKLNLPRKTVDRDRQRLMDKLGVCSMAGLVKAAVQLGHTSPYP